MLIQTVLGVVPLPETNVLVLLEQGYSTLPAGVRMSSTGRTTTYERAIAWKVMDANDTVECIAFLFMNWSFVT